MTHGSGGTPLASASGTKFQQRRLGHIHLEARPRSRFCLHVVPACLEATGADSAFLWEQGPWKYNDCFLRADTFHGDFQTAPDKLLVCAGASAALGSAPHSRQRVRPQRARPLPSRPVGGQPRHSAGTLRGHGSPGDPYSRSPRAKHHRSVTVVRRGSGWV